MSLQLYSIINAAPQAVIYLFSIPIVLISLTIHEVSHGYAAYKLGDPTAKSLGRLSLNPLKHLDPIGAIFMVLFKFGWAKPVPINTRYFKKPRRDMALTALAGPASNLLLAFFSLLIYIFICRFSISKEFSNTAAMFIGYLALFFNYAHILNLSLCVFNLIPIPPLDGSRILNIFLPDKIYFGIMKYERYIYLGLILLVWLGAFTGLITTFINLISDGMMWLIKLIPYFSIYK